MQLGIDKQRNLVYEGSGMSGHAIWPSPIILPAVFTTSLIDHISASDGKLDPLSYIFREDSFDPLSRVRYGRLYRAGEGQPAQWSVEVHPARPDEERQKSRGFIKKELYTFHACRLANALRDLGEGQPLVILGTESAFTIWTIVTAETTTSGDELISLKSRESYGALPNLINNALPEVGKDKVIDAISVLHEDIHRAGPESVVDRARESATVVLSVYLESKGAAPTEKELGKLISAFQSLEKDGKQIVANAATIARIFHSRSKHAVKEKMPIRPLVEQDAELAVNCIGAMLCDLGWARW